ncbi:MAG TPA: PIN domain-containing protein [Terriglobales bacterium]|jgi:hypothetical protein
MVLVDTSVWIHFLRDREPYGAHLYALLHAHGVAGHSHVRGELLIGDNGERSELLAQYRTLPWAGSVPDNEVESLIRHRRLHGRGIGWIDAHLLASALVYGHRLWSADAALIQLAQELNVNYAAAMLER